MPTFNIIYVIVQVFLQRFQSLVGKVASAGSCRAKALSQSPAQCVYPKTEAGRVRLIMT